MAVWAFQRDGKRLGMVGAKSGDIFSVYLGSAGPLDDKQFVVADAALQTLHIVPGGPTLTRPVTKGSCTSEDLEYLGSTSTPKRACKQHLAKHYLPFSDLELLRVDGKLVALDGKRQLLWLDDKKLSVSKRVQLPVCKK
jgi:hypothetical protein